MLKISPDPEIFEANIAMEDLKFKTKSRIKFFKRDFSKIQVGGKMQNFMLFPVVQVSNYKNVPLSLKPENYIKNATKLY